MAEPNGGVGDGLVGMLNVFVDPESTAKRVPSKLFWVWPVVALVVGYFVFASLMLPYSQQMGEAALRNVPAESMDRARSMTVMITKIITFATPVFVIGFIALFALLIRVVYTLMDIRPRFRDVFGLLAACSLIPFLQYAAGYFVIRIKGDPIDNAEQIQPPFGLDIFFQGVHGAAFALLHYFSIFQIWYLVVLVFGLAYLTKSSKTQAAIAVTPAWILPLAMAMIGAMFQKSPS